MFGVFWWYCCLNPRERSILHSTCEGLTLTLNVGIPLALWEAFWAVTLDNGQAARDAFLEVFRLEIVNIMDDDEMVDVVRPTVDGLFYWVVWEAYILTPGAACLSGCEQSHVP